MHSEEGGGTGPRITFQNEMDMDQALLASEARTPGFAIGDTDYGNRPAGKFPDHLEWDQRSSGSLFLSPSAEDSYYIGETERTEASRGMLSCDDVVGFRSRCTSREESS